MTNNILRLEADALELKALIKPDLSIELDRKPSPEEVSARYNQVIED